MAYEVFKRSGVRVEEPSVSLVPDGRITFNAAAVRLLSQAGVKFVLLLWDGSTKRVALKAAAKGHKNAFAVSIVRDSYSGSLRAKSFLDYIGWNAPKRTRLPAAWHEKERMFEITLPKDYLRPKRIRNLGDELTRGRRRRK
jgi:hypothetical protein